MVTSTGPHSHSCRHFSHPFLKSRTEEAFCVTGEMLPWILKKSSWFPHKTLATTWAGQTQRLQEGRAFSCWDRDFSHIHTFKVFFIASCCQSSRRGISGQFFSLLWLYFLQITRPVAFDHEFTHTRLIYRGSTIASIGQLFYWRDYCRQRHKLPLYVFQLWLIAFVWAENLFYEKKNAVSKNVSAISDNQSFKVSFFSGLDDLRW